MNQEAKPTGGKSRAGYTEEFKRSVVDHWCHSDKTAEQVAKEFGVKIRNVRDWRRPYGPTHKPMDAPMPEKPEDLKRELQQVRKELAWVVHRSINQVNGEKLDTLNVTSVTSDKGYYAVNELEALQDEGIRTIIGDPIDHRRVDKLELVVLGYFFHSITHRGLADL